MSIDPTLPDADGPFVHRIVVAELPGRRITKFELVPEAEDLAKIAKALDLIGLRKLRFAGQLAPVGKTDWALNAQLGATVTQSCVVTLEPVTTRLDVPVDRLWMADLPSYDTEEDEIEMTEDENVEPLAPVIDLGHVLCEALALALPPYPRSDAADAATLTSQVFAAPDVKPMTDEDAKPFAGLAALRDQMGAKKADTPDDEDKS